MLKQTKKSSVTIDSLARMVQKGFEQTAGREEMSKRFDGVDKHLDNIENRLDRIEKKILENHEKRIRRLEEALAL